jgi:sugar lactone lactonase YvrE
MNATVSAVLLACVLFSAAALAEPLPANASFTTLVTTPLAIEGLTGDASGNLYTTGRETAASRPPCPVWKINIATRTRTTVGFIPNPAAGCNPSGITMDEAGRLYIADAASGGVIWRVTPDEAAPPSVTTPFATGVPGTNGLAFDRDGNLWTGDGTTGLGRVWRISPNGAVAEVFRIQPMRNPAGVGRENTTLQPPQTPPVAPNPQNLVANGLAFNHAGNLFIADTARGAIWKAQFNRQGELVSATGCDTTFTTNTLCMDNVFVAHPLLEGTDGIALDRAGNIWNSANERNAIVVVTSQGGVTEVFRNPVDSTGLRNSGNATVGNNHILEFPTSPVLLGSLFCTANSDGNRRDNSPFAAGEVFQLSTDTNATPRGKISCMEEELHIPGLRLPIR